MKDRLATLETRIDALALRERIFLLLSVLLVVGALVDTVWITPARQEHARARSALDANTAELVKLREEVRLKASQPSPQRAAQEELARVEARIEETQRSLSALSDTFKNSTSLQDVLVHFLRRHPTLTLLKTGNLAVDATAPRSAAIARTGLELTLSGPYGDLMRYVKALETAMPDLRWGALRVNAESQPPQLTIEVFLAGGAP